ncbi:calphotin isoform X2 [Amphiprion ocellaris]|uniref:calphotin isoform X2 n=1 Tax=Amphiprion ocellaris TaxID=80972 RepID=UPI002410BB2B|nr:calphotin isoform X2 [Amphiprion ocellaris]
MAASVLRVGRLGALKCLQLESWGILRSRPAAFFCTQVEEPPKPAKKAQAAGKKAPDERTALLTCKTTVAFPARLLEPRVFPAQSLGITGPVVGCTAVVETAVAAAVAGTASEMDAAEPVVAVPVAASSDPAPEPDVAQVIPDIAPPVVDTAPLAVKPQVETSSETSAPDNTAFPDAGEAAANESSSSSSGDSESDSDSDSESERSDVKADTRIFPHEISESTVKKGAEVHEVTRAEVTEDSNEAQGEPEATLTFGADTIHETAANSEAVQGTRKAPTVSSDELITSVPEICTTTEDAEEVTRPVASAESAVEAAPEMIQHNAGDAFSAVSDTEVETPAEVVTKATTPENDHSDSNTKTTEPASAEAATQAGDKLADVVEAAAEAAESSAETSPAKAEPEIIEAKASPTEEAAETATEVSALAEGAEQLVDSAPVVAEAAEEELQVEAPAEQSEEAITAAHVEPEEHFDNSTYKNYQHHSYTPYTFADLDVEMAKFRLPQPSSGRPSPRH